jgi:hypothetical protein
MTGKEVDIMKASFQLGAVVMTQGAKRLMEELGLDLAHYLARHVTGDWGNLDEHDKQENELSVKKGFRVLSAYGEADGKLWVITEADGASQRFLVQRSTKATARPGSLSGIPVRRGRRCCS